MADGVPPHCALHPGEASPNPPGELPGVTRGAASPGLLFQLQSSVLEPPGPGDPRQGTQIRDECRAASRQLLLRPGAVTGNVGCPIPSQMEQAENTTVCRHTTSGSCSRAAAAPGLLGRSVLDTGRCILDTGGGPSVRCWGQGSQTGCLPLETLVSGCGPLSPSLQGLLMGLVFLNQCESYFTRLK